MVHARKSQQHPIEKSQQLQRKLYLAAKRDRERRFHALYDRIYRPDILWRAWKEVRANKGCAGIDNVSIEEVEALGVEVFLKELSEDLRGGTYRPQAVKRVNVPKPDGSERPLGIPTIRDRVAQQACRIVIEPLFEANFQECSYGFRPRRSAQNAACKVKESLVRSWWVVDVDIEEFFDSLDHDILMALLNKRISDRRVLKLIRLWLRAGVLTEREVCAVKEGTPQGGVISPLLANIYLHVFDMYWMLYYSHLGKLYRYADDFVILCRYRQDAKEAMNVITHIMAKLKLSLHKEKTKLLNIKETGFDFLGFHFRKFKSRNTGKIVPYFWPSQDSMKSIRSKIRQITAKRWDCCKLEAVAKALVAVIRGYRNYFQVGNSTKQLQQLDSYLLLRIKQMYRRRMRRNLTRIKQHYDVWMKWYSSIRFFQRGKCGVVS